jgi:phosphoribosylformimino-5-aminoimidazole carboxamide ribotide isomerase
MLIFPAIDIKDGECVRLYRGDYATAHKVAEGAVDTAQKFEAAGATWLHMVDLNGAKDAHPVNEDLIFSVVQKTGLHVEVGGGIRRMETVTRYLENGVARVILGSAALRDPDFTAEAIRTYGPRIAIGIDARDGKVAAEGWLETSSVDYIEMGKRMEQLGASTLIFTDISRDGMLSGPNLTMLDALNKAVSCDVVASGGISGPEDIRALKQLNLYGAICGKSIYTGALDLHEALKIAGGNADET